MLRLPSGKQHTDKSLPRRIFKMKKWITKKIYIIINIHRQDVHKITRYFIVYIFPLRTRDMIRNNKIGSVIFKFRQGEVYFYNIINKTNRNGALANNRNG